MIGTKIGLGLRYFPVRPRWIAWLNRRSSHQALSRAFGGSCSRSREIREAGRRRPGHQGCSRRAVEWNDQVKEGKYPSKTGHRLWPDMRLARPWRTLLGHMTVLLRRSVTLLAAAARGVRLRPRPHHRRRNHNWSKPTRPNSLHVSRKGRRRQRMRRWRAIPCRTHRNSKQRKGPIGWKRRSRALQFPMMEKRGRAATYHARPIPLSYRPDIAR